MARLAAWRERDGDYSAHPLLRATRIVWRAATRDDYGEPAVRAGAMRDHLERGARRFFLIASPAGRPLYERIGFELVRQTQVWVSGTSAQAG